MTEREILDQTDRHMDAYITYQAYLLAVPRNCHCGTQKVCRPGIETSMRPFKNIFHFNSDLYRSLSFKDNEISSKKSCEKSVHTVGQYNVNCNPYRNV